MKWLFGVVGLFWGTWFGYYHHIKASILLAVIWIAFGLFERQVRNRDR
jgi:hypothetical protein